MSNKDNLPVKYKKAGKPKVKEQVTQWVEQIEIFDGFNFDFKLLVEAILFLVVGGGVLTLVTSVLPENLVEIIVALLGVVFWLFIALIAYDSWEKRLEAGPVMHVFYTVQSILYGSGLLLCTAGILLAVFVSGTWASIFVIGFIIYLVALFLTFFEACIETRTEERVVAEEGGEQQ